MTRKQEPTKYTTAIENGRRLIEKLQALGYCIQLIVRRG